MEFKIGDLVKVEERLFDRLGVIVSDPVETPGGYTVKVAFNNKILSMYTWCISPVQTKERVG
jgi:hypothetical protein